MQKIKNILFLLLVTFLMSCEEIKIENGEIPTEYLSQVQKLMGVYHGQFEGKISNLYFTLDGRRVRVKYQDQQGKDIISPECESSIGDLSSVLVSGTKDNPLLQEASFRFQPNKCQQRILGRYLTFKFSFLREGIRLDARIIERDDWVTECEGPYPQNCRTYPVHVYLRGTYFKNYSI